MGCVRHKQKSADFHIKAVQFFVKTLRAGGGGEVGATTINRWQDMKHPFSPSVRGVGALEVEQ